MSRSISQSAIPPTTNPHVGLGLIDRAKSVRRTLVDRLLPQRFVFHHVPKCGGTSVGRALRKRYLPSQATVLPEQSFRAFEAFTGRGDREQMLVDVLDLREQMLLYLMYGDTRCVSAHVRFSQAAYDNFSNSYKFITILREPVSRFLSHYNWSHNKPGAHGEITDDFDAFLQTDRAARMGASYVEYFSALPSDADLRTDVAVGRAVANLGRFDVVGRLDDLDAFTGAVRQRLGFRIRIGHENKNRAADGGIKAQDLSADQMQIVREHCAPDIAIWQRAP